MPIDFSAAWKTAIKIVNSAIALLPNISLALVIFVVFTFLGSLAKSSVRKLAQRRGRRQNLGLLLGHLAHVTVVLFGFLIALSTVAPSFHASDLVKVLGIGSVAIGFAFQNILKNFLAGILLLLQEPFRLGDWISVTGMEGRVEDIQTRATIISTSDEQRIVIPNAVLFANPVIVGQAAAKKAESSAVPVS